MSIEFLLITSAIIIVVLFSAPLLLFGLPSLGLPNPGLKRQNNIQSERSAKLKVWAIDNLLTTTTVERDLTWAKLGLYTKNISNPSIAIESRYKGVRIKIFDYVQISQGSHSPTHLITGILCQFPSGKFPQFMIVPKNGAYPFRFARLKARLMPSWAKDKFHFSFHIDSRQPFKAFVQEIDRLPEAVNTSAFKHIFGYEDSICLVQKGEVLTNRQHYRWLESIAHEMIDLFSHGNILTDASLEIKGLKESEKK